jgi:hypothetical protein
VTKAGTSARLIPLSVIWASTCMKAWPTRCSKVH